MDTPAFTGLDVHRSGRSPGHGSHDRDNAGDRDR